MTSEFFAGNRQRLLDAMEEGSVAFLYSGVVPIKSNDQNMNPFSVNRNFYYLTGIDTQNVWFVLSKSACGIEETLFIDQPDGGDHQVERPDADPRGGQPAQRYL